jgi:branched-chain amino acid transport system substrate-binding protein
MAESKQNTLLWAIGGVLILMGVIYFSVVDGNVSVFKVGVIAPLTGDDARLGEVVRRSYDLGVEEINAAGGVGGKMMELVYEDGKCDGSTATTAAEKLIRVDGVKFILGGTCSTETLAAAEITQEARVLLLSATATNPEISEAGDLVYRTYPSDVVEAKLVADYGITSGQARAAVISENTDFAQSVRKAFNESYTGTVVFDESFNTGETDFLTQITKMRAANPQMVYVLAQTTEVGELILKQIEKSGMNVAIFAASSMLDRNAFLANPSLYEEVVFSEVQLPDSGLTNAMLEAYTGKYGAFPESPVFTASAYDSVYLLVEAVRARGEDAQAVAQYFNTLTDWAGALGTFNFDERGDAEVERTLVQVIGGQLVPLTE